MIDGQIGRDPISLSSMASECERLAWGEDYGERKRNPIAYPSMVSECERPRKSRPGTTYSIVVERTVYATLNVIRIHLTSLGGSYSLDSKRV